MVILNTKKKKIKNIFMMENLFFFLNLICDIIWGTVIKITIKVIYEHVSIKMKAKVYLRRVIYNMFCIVVKF